MSFEYKEILMLSREAFWLKNFLALQARETAKIYSLVNFINNSFIH